MPSSPPGNAGMSPRGRPGVPGGPTQKGTAEGVRMQAASAQTSYQYRPIFGASAVLAKPLERIPQIRIAPMCAVRKPLLAKPRARQMLRRSLALTHVRSRQLTFAHIRSRSLTFSNFLSLPLTELEANAIRVTKSKNCEPRRKAVGPQRHLGAPRKTKHADCPRGEMKTIDSCKH